MSFQALPNIIFHRELAGVIVVAVVGVALVALVPAKQPVERASAVVAYALLWSQSLMFRLSCAVSSVFSGSPSYG